MKLTDKNTITSIHEPKSKTVTWVDMSTGSPVMKKFINGMWRPVGGGGSILNPGYTVVRDFVTLDNESVTTIKPVEAPASVGEFTNTIELEEGSTYIVVFDEVEYQCVARSENGSIVIGDDVQQFDFTEYPFIIVTHEGTRIITENPGTYQVEIKEFGIDSVTVSDDFSDAVGYVNETLPSLKCATVIPNDYSDWTAGFKIYFQKECIYDTAELHITPEVIVDSETPSMIIQSGNRQSFSEILFDIDALLVPFFNGVSNVILYKNNYQHDYNGIGITFSSVNQIVDSHTIITGSNCIYIYCNLFS